jgi:cyclopropane-fatty-acyl-phospholipid synthase
MTATTAVTMYLTEHNLLPDFVVRHGIRRLLRQRLQQLSLDNCETRSDRIDAFVSTMCAGPIAPVPEKANEQHYEVSADFFGSVLGSIRKYSSAYWPEGVTTLNAAEVAALHHTCNHAELTDGQRILELGCGWGSLTLWMAEHYPHSQITAVSNSHSQRRYIESVANTRGLSNVKIITADMNTFNAGAKFDRVVSVEMFEHMRNYELLFQRIHDWLVPGGKLFFHIFCHRDTPYEFVDQGASDWMSRYFFSGGIMPSDNLPLHFQSHLKFQQRWRWNGTHYGRTAEAWLQNMDANKANIWPVLEQTYGTDQAGIWWGRWRIFFMACAELFAYDNGQQWWVSHYLFERPLEAG